MRFPDLKPVFSLVPAQQNMPSYWGEETKNNDSPMKPHNRGQGERRGKRWEEAAGEGGGGGGMKRREGI